MTPFPPAVVTLRAAYALCHRLGRPELVTAVLAQLREEEAVSPPLFATPACHSARVARALARLASTNAAPEDATMHS